MFFSPEPRTAIVDNPLSNAAWCAVSSIPKASPEVIHKSVFLNSEIILVKTAFPVAEHFLEPTTATLYLALNKSLFP